MRNTKKLGTLRMFVYKSGTQYIGVCLELNEVVADRTLEGAVKRLFNASQGYIETVIKEGLSDDLLNQRAPVKFYIIYYGGKLIGMFKKMKDFFNIRMPVVDGDYGIQLPA